MEMRIVQIYYEGQWIEVEFEVLQEGDVFRLFEEIDEPVIDPDGCTAWRCATDPYYMPGEDYGYDEDVLGVQCDPVYEV